jgi:hypothetical protein
MTQNPDYFYDEKNYGSPYTQATSVSSPSDSVMMASLYDNKGTMVNFGSSPNCKSPPAYSSPPVYHASPASMPAPVIQEPDITKMKQRRKRNTVVAGVTAGVAGTILLGPLGGIVGGVGGAMTAKAIGKRKERRKMKKYNDALNAAAESRYGKPIDATGGVVA